MSPVVCTAMLLLLLLLLLVCGSASATSFTGDGTAYSDSVTDGKGFACSYRFLPEFARRNFVAMNAAQWDDGQACGKCVKVHCVDAKCTVQSEVVLYVVDKCPECARGDLDLSIPSYRDVTGFWPNRLKVSPALAGGGALIGRSICSIFF
jgi:expansin (peptidoglycan-binding protein)